MDPLDCRALAARRPEPCPQPPPQPIVAPTRQPGPKNQSATSLLQRPLAPGKVVVAGKLTRQGGPAQIYAAAPQLPAPGSRSRAPSPGASHLRGPPAALARLAHGGGRALHAGTEGRVRGREDGTALMLTVPGAQPTPVNLAHPPQGQVAEGLGLGGTGGLRLLSAGESASAPPREPGSPRNGKTECEGLPSRARASRCPGVARPSPSVPSSRATSEIRVAHRDIVAQSRANNSIHNSPGPPQRALEQEA